jgi:hypothetical protein
MKVEPAAVTVFLREERQVKASTADGWDGLRSPLALQPFDFLFCAL